MKKFFILLFGLFLPFTFASVIHAQEEKIEEFKSNITVNNDATIDISEVITFTPSLSTPRHGLEWRIPYIYSVKAFRRNTILDINKVVYYPLSNPEDRVFNVYSRNDENGWAILRIGRENEYISETYVYEIDYTLKYSGISYFKDNDEVYLNIIGPGWNIPIQSASALITLPFTPLDTICYTGSDGSTKQNCSITQEENMLNVSVNGRLEPYEGYTFAAKLAKGIIEDTTATQRWYFLLANIGILIPIPVGIFLFVFLQKRFKNKKLTVIPQYEPEKDMDALLSAGIYTPSKFNPKYISAVLIELATKGYLKIREFEKNKYEFVKRDKDGSDLSPHLKDLFNAIFAHGDVVPIKKLSNFYLTANKVNTEATHYLKDQDLLSVSKMNARSILTVVSIILFFIAIWISGSLIENSAIGTFLGILFSTIILFIFTTKIDIKTIEGNKRYYYLLGLKMYIETAESKRIEFHNDPKRYNEIFEKLLPYAMIFNFEKKWAKIFEDIYTTSPDWYEGDFSVFDATYLANSLNTFNKSVVTSSAPPNKYGSSDGYRSGGWSSGGSGFSGGSSGGGGGGSGGGGW